MQVACAAWAGWCGGAQAANVTVSPGVEARVGWSDNAGFTSGTSSATNGEKVSDTTLELIPSFALRAEGKRFRIGGSIGVDALKSLNDAQPSRVLPRIDLTSSLEAIERFFFIDAGVVARQQSENVFGPRAQGGSTVNTATTYDYRVAPRFEGRLGGETSYRLSSDNSWTHSVGTDNALVAADQGNGTYQGTHALHLERRPTPLGWSLDVRRSETRFESSQPPATRTDSGRLTIDYALSPEFSLGVRGGYERTNVTVQDESQTIVGAGFAWKPSVRTDLNAFWERRFFGNGWNLAFNHRMPRLAWSLSWSRDLQSFNENFLTLPATNDVAALLDAAFATRITDPAERARAVSDVMARQGLPSSLSTETSLFRQRVSIVQSRRLSLTYLGLANSITLSGYSSRTEDPNGSVFVTTQGALNVQQDGAGLTFSHILSSQASVSLTGVYTHVHSLDTTAPSESRQTSVEGRYTRQLSSRSSAFLGARWQRFSSSGNLAAAAVSPTSERGAFIGLAYRY